MTATTAGSIPSRAVSKPRLPNERFGGAVLAFAGAGALVTFTAVAVAFVSIWLRGERVLAVVQPLVVLLILGTAFFGVLTLRERAAPFLSLGGFTGAMILLYSVYPLAIYVINGGVYTMHNDGRLFFWPPAPGDIAIFGWWYVLFFVSFAIAYLGVAPTGPRLRPLAVRRLPGGLMLMILFAFVVLQIYLTMTQYVFDLGGGDYLAAYAKVQNLPLLVRQFYVHLAEMRITMLILLLCMLFARYRKYRGWIFLMIVIELVITLRVIHSRSELFIFLVAATVLYHNVVRRIPVSIAVIGGALLVSAFTLLAAIRQDGNQITAESVARGNSEFEVIMANAYDLRTLRGATGVLRREPGIYFSDLTNIFPQQVLPFAKRNKAEWFLNTFYPTSAAEGAGYAFGVLSEAVTGFGWIELVVRGAVVGLAFGFVQRRFSGGAVTVWQIAIYVWMIVFSYQILRNTTFYYLALGEYSFVVPVILFRSTYFLLSMSGQRLRALVRP